jgi:NAD(P)-dependent dehydrogenase (short-subunit alcohol dehydrogenase family)
LTSRISDFPDSEYSRTSIVFSQLSKRKKGRLDILFANAGGGAFVPLEEVTEEHYDKYFGINIKGKLFTVQKELPLMPSGGSIVINGSMVSIKGVPAFSVYAATKAALRSFARTWTADLKGRNIRVNVVAPERSLDRDTRVNSV